MDGKVSELEVVTAGWKGKGPGLLRGKPTGNREGKRMDGGKVGDVKERVSGREPRKNLEKGVVSVARRTTKRKND